MHERYFFAFEMAAIILAAIDRRYLTVAVQAQVSGLACYLAYDDHNPLSVTEAAGVNALLVARLWRRLLAWREPPVSAEPAELRASNALGRYGRWTKRFWMSPTR